MRKACGIAIHEGECVAGFSGQLQPTKKPIIRGFRPEQDCARAITKELLRRPMCILLSRFCDPEKLLQWQSRSAEPWCIRLVGWLNESDRLLRDCKRAKCWKRKAQLADARAGGCQFDQRSDRPPAAGKGSIERRESGRARIGVGVLASAPKLRNFA